MQARFEKWLQRLSTTGFVGVGLGLVTVFFGAGAADWWIAQQIPWWAFGLLSLVVTVTLAVIKTARKVGLPR